MSSARLAQFQDEVAKLKVTGGGANPERTRRGVGHRADDPRLRHRDHRRGGAPYNATSFEDIHRAAIFAAIGIGVSLVGIVIWLRNSITRYLRYWIIRLVYEQREQTDRLIEALERERSRPRRLGVGESRNGTFLSTAGSPGRPSTRSPITLRWICSVPPPSGCSTA